MGIRAYTGGQLGNSTTAENQSPTGLTVEEVQDVIGIALNNAVQGGTTVYDDVTGTIGITLPNAEVATSTSAGAIIPGTGLTVDANGIVTPNVATATTTGIVRIGTGLAVDGFGTLSAVVSSAGATALSGLTDVDTNGVTTGQILKYDGTSFVPADDAGIADYNNLTNLPTLFDGDYTSLSNLPTLPTDISDLTDVGNLIGSGGGGAAGPQGPAGADGADGATGATGATGPAGADGATGPAGADGAAGPQGVAGATGATGPAGIDGTTITTATVDVNDDLLITLSDGTVINAGNSTGATGATGAQGATGATGPQGAQGLQGLGVASATVDANDDLIIVLSDGSQLNAGNTAGPQGIQGIQGSTGATGAVGPAGNGVATATVDANDDLQITLTDGSIINAGNTAGPQGLQGIQGATGATGSAGLNGLSITSAVKDANDDLIITLSDGATINAGNITGPQGLQGIQGPAGADSTVAGPAGADGADGADGATGPAGPAGATGPAGPAGADGADGSNGIDLTAFSITTGALTANGGLAYDNTTGVFTFNPVTAGGASNVTSIGTLSDVDVTGLTDGQVLAFDSGSNTWEPTTISGGGASTLSALTDVSTTAPAIGQAIAWDGSEWAPTTISGGGGGASSGIFRAEVTVNYASNGSLSSVSVLSGGISATVVDSTSTVCTVEFEFTGSVCNPLSIQVYGYQRVANQYVTRALASDFSNRKVAAGGSSGSPTAFNSYNPATNKLTLSLTKSLTGASGGLGQTTEAIVSFLLSNS